MTSFVHLNHRHRSARWARRPRRAIALLLVLGLIALLGLLATALTQSLKIRLIEQTRRDARAELREAAYAGLSAKVAEIAEYRAVDGSVFGPGQGWAGLSNDTTAYATSHGVTLRTQVTDESARLPINTTDVAGLAKLFRHLDVPDGPADHLAGALADWIDPNDATRVNGAEKDAYAENAGPANAPLKNLDELLRIAGFAEWFLGEDGLPNARFARLAELVSVYADSARPNINGASYEVMEFLTRDTGVDAVRLAEARDNGTSRGVFRQPGELALAGASAVLGSRVTFTATLLRIRAIASRGDISWGVEALVRVRAGAFKVESETEMPAASNDEIESENQA